jgi:hypothetical protein
MTGSPKMLVHWLREPLVLFLAIGALFRKSQTVTTALKAQAAGQLRELAGYILKQAQEPELRQRAEAVIAFAGRLDALARDDSKAVFFEDL